MEKIRWAICDDDEFFCYIFSEMLESYDDLSYVGGIASSKECIEFLAENKPDVLLLDIHMETKTAGIDIIPELNKASPKTKIIMLTGFLEEDMVFDAIANGANSYLLKESDKENIVNIIRRVYNDEDIFPPEIMHIIVNKTKSLKKGMKSLLYMFEIMSNLSKTEFEILQMLYNGASYKTIAEKRKIAESSVRNYISRILKKFGCPTMNILITQLKELEILEYLDEKNDHT